MLYDHRIVRSHKGLPNVLYPQKQRECINTSKRVLEHIHCVGNSLGLKHDIEAIRLDLTT
jgi:hypothetical protein